MTETCHGFEICNHVSDKHIRVLEMRVWTLAHDFVTIFEIEVFLQFLLEEAAKNDEWCHSEPHTGHWPRKVEAK